LLRRPRSSPLFPYTTLFRSQAMERACGTPALFIRSGGSIPIVADLAARGIPTVVSGFAVPADRIHAPDESYLLRSLELGEASARELLPALAGASHQSCSSGPSGTMRWGLSSRGRVGECFVISSTRTVSAPPG